MQRHFDEELKGLNRNIILIADKVKNLIHKSIESLNDSDQKKAMEVIEEDNVVDALELEIDEQCIDLIAKHQPMARDLRFITTGMKINAELERIADLAVNIAQRVLELTNKPKLKNFNDILALAFVAESMINDAIQSFVDKNIETAKKVLASDKEADELRNSIQGELIKSYLAIDPTTAERAVALILIARHLERICDHTTNIAEDVFYMVNGKVVKHHFEELN